MIGGQATEPVTAVHPISGGSAPGSVPTIVCGLKAISGNLALSSTSSCIFLSRLPLPVAVLRASISISPPAVPAARKIDVQHLGAPVARPQQATQHLDERGLAGAVRTEQAVNLAALDPKVHAADRVHPATARIDERPGQVARDEHRRAV